MRSEERGVRRERFSVRAVCTSIVVLTVTISRANSAAAFSFEDIKYWIGTGTNRAAFIVDWADDAAEPPALAWGYRWDGTATGAQMLRAIVADDPRLFAKLGGTIANPTAVYGLGYDADGDSDFSIDDGTVFDSKGFAFTGPDDGASAVDAGDNYAEGWILGFWHYGIAGSNPYVAGSWSDSGGGMASRQLADGAWDSWAFTPSFDFTAFSENPVAAPSPFPPGDYDHDGQVTASDYASWRQSFGSTSLPAADGNHNGVVDAADYVVWRKSISTGLGSSAAAASSKTIPEPSAATALFSLLFVAVCRRGERTQILKD
jgi:hypothetical protein